MCARVSLRRRIRLFKLCVCVKLFETFGPAELFSHLSSCFPAVGLLRASASPRLVAFPAQTAACRSGGLAGEDGSSCSSCETPQRKRELLFSLRVIVPENKQRLRQRRCVRHNYSRTFTSAEQTSGGAKTDGGSHRTAARMEPQFAELAGF